MRMLTFISDFVDLLHPDQMRIILQGYMTQVGAGSGMGSSSAQLGKESTVYNPRWSNSHVKLSSEHVFFNVYLNCGCVLYVCSYLSFDLLYRVLFLLWNENVFSIGSVVICIGNSGFDVCGYIL